MRILRVGTRGSRLALIQTDSVLQMLRRTDPNLHFRRVVVTTSGDKDRTKPFEYFGLKGIFEKEINLALARGEVDFAIHSLKDIPSEGYNGLTIASITKRDSPNDALVSRGMERLSELKAGSVVGTSSQRRMVQIRYTRPDLTVKPLRGNVETRVSEVDGGKFDAAVIAEAGLRRLGLEDKVSERLPLDAFTPAPGQGALAVVARKNDLHILELLSRVDDSASRNEADVERRVAARLGGGCQAPIGVIARQNGGGISAYASIFSVNGREKVVSSVIGDTSNPIDSADNLSSNLVEMGASRIIDGWRKKY